MQQSTLALHNYVSYACHICVALHLHGLVYCSFKSFNRRNLFQTSSLAWHSAQDVLLYVSDSLLQAIDTGQYVGAIFLDLAKAFDCVNHDILLQKLDCNSIEGCAYEWMKSFLCGRTQQVCVQNTISSRGLITIRVPQGSILGPLLFSIYANDLPNSIGICDINMYSDDAELRYCHSQLQTIDRAGPSD